MEARCTVANDRMAAHRLLKILKHRLLRAVHAEAIKRAMPVWELLRIPSLEIVRPLVLNHDAEHVRRFQDIRAWLALDRPEVGGQLQASVGDFVDIAPDRACSWLMGRHVKAEDAFSHLPGCPQLEIVDVQLEVRGLLVCLLFKIRAAYSLTPLKDGKSTSLLCQRRNTQKRQIPLQPSRQRWAPF